MNKCSKALEVMGAYVYGELPPDEMKRVRSHLETCQACYEEMRSQAVAVGSIPTESPQLSESDRERIFWSVQGAVRGKPEGAGRIPPLWKAIYGLGATGVVASALVVGIMIGMQRPPRTHVISLPPTPSGQPSLTEVPPLVPPAPTEDAPEPEATASPVEPAPEPAPAPAIAPIAPGVARTSPSLPNRQGKKSGKRIRRKPRISEENASPVQQNHVEPGSDSSSAPVTTEDPAAEGAMPSATTAPAPAGVDDVRETPLPSEGETSTR